MLTSQEIYEKMSGSAVTKAEGTFLRLLIMGILAGAYIAFGAEASSMASFNLIANPGTFGLGKLAAAIVFPVGLMLVLLCGAELFTGNCLMVCGIADKRISTSAMLRNWAIVYIGNLIGALLIVFMMSLSGLWESGGGLLGAITVKTAASKAGLSFGKAFILGILCNWLVCLAVWMAAGSKEFIGKIFAILFCVGAFVLSGFEHSVANMYFIPAGIAASGNEAFVAAAGVDISGLNVYGFLVKNLLPVTLGNIVGGSLFVGMAYWLVNKKL
ncbi:MAG: formate/nitrite transporter family protein [Clostridiales bacterium]|nr:formate/nitrite transporter family protein [Clostridiales bacterium]